jgi:hypothetical protein
VDLDELLERVDLDPVLDRVDVNALLARIDVNALLAQVDVDALVARTDLAATMASTATGVADSTLRTLRRRLAEADAWVGGRATGCSAAWTSRRGPDAGAVSRLLAYIVDHVTLTVAFSVGATVVGFLVRLLTGHRLYASANLTAGVAPSVWWFASFAASARVLGPARPSTVRPRPRWKARTAASVCGPKTPSAAMPAPWWRSRCWSARTGGPCMGVARTGQVRCRWRS